MSFQKFKTTLEGSKLINGNGLKTKSIRMTLKDKRHSFFLKMKRNTYTISCDCGKIECHNIFNEDTKSLGINKKILERISNFDLNFSKIKSKSIILRDENGITPENIGSGCFTFKCKQCRSKFFMFQTNKGIIIGYPIELKFYNEAFLDMNLSKYIDVEIPQIPFTMSETFVTFNNLNTNNIMLDKSYDSDELFSIDLDEELMFSPLKEECIVGSYEDRPMLDEIALI